MGSARRPARSPAAFVPERAAGRPTAGPMSRGRLLGAAGEGRRAGRGAGLGLSGRRGAREERAAPLLPGLGKARVPAGDEAFSWLCRSLCQRSSIGYGGPWLVTRIPPLRTRHRLPFQGSQTFCSWAASLPFRWGDPRVPQFRTRWTWSRSSSVDQELGKLLESFFFLFKLAYGDNLRFPDPRLALTLTLVE